MSERMQNLGIQRTFVPFPASWIDRLIRRIDRMWGPTWLFYVVAVLAVTLLIYVSLWIDGGLPYGSFDPIQGIFPPLVLYPLALYHYLKRIGSISLKSYRPLLDVNDETIAQVDYEIANLPRWLGWLAIPLGFGPAAYYILGNSTSFGDLLPNTALPYAAAIVAAGFSYAALLALVMRSLRQLKLVRELHAQATSINLLKLQPAHAFSKLTARTGIGVALLLILAYFYNPLAFYNALDITLYVVNALLAVVIFVAPIMGIRELLEEEKNRQLDETSDLIQTTSDSLYSMVRNENFDNLQGIEAATRALIRKREMLEKIPTWPWNPGTIRGFVSTLLLPIFLWLVTRLLGRFF